jgi:ParB/RepB/Spo0J family partition protein
MTTNATTTSTTPKSSDLQFLDIALLDPWADQPRGRRDPANADSTLFASVKAHGIIQNLIVRPGKAAGRFLIVAGERRFHAAVAAQLDQVPVSIRDLSDAEALTIALTENMQRKDMHPLAEADAIARLQREDPAAKSPAALAARLGVPESHIRQRLKYAKLTKLGRAAFAADAITAHHAELLSRISDAKLADRALDEGCFYELHGNEVQGAIAKGAWAEVRDHVAPIAVLREWMNDNIVANIHDQELQKELPDVGLLMTAAEKSGVPVLQLSQTNYQVPKGIIQRAEWRAAGGKEKRCDLMKRYPVVHGGPTVVVEACLNKKCKTHWPEHNRPATTTATSGTATRKLSAEEIRYQKQDAARRKKDAAWTKLKKDARAALVKIVVSQATLSADLVASVLSKYAVKEVADRTGVTLTDKTAAAVLALHVMGQAEYGRTTFAAFGKKYKFDLAKFERDSARQVKAKKSPAKKRKA